MEIPRLVIAAPMSGSGKTTIVTALIAAFVTRGVGNGSQNLLHLHFLARPELVVRLVQAAHDTCPWKGTA